MIITIGHNRINPDHIVLLNTNKDGIVCIVMVTGDVVPVYDVETEEELAGDINDAIRREQQRGHGQGKEFTPRGLE
jgi:hypothetical protein